MSSSVSGKLRGGGMERRDSAQTRAPGARVLVRARAQEAMRLYPAGGIATFRLPTGRKPVVLNGGKLVLPPGVILHTPIAAIQHSEANWERAGEFLPSRWEQVPRPGDGVPVALLMRAWSCEAARRGPAGGCGMSAATGWARCAVRTVCSFG